MGLWLGQTLNLENRYLKQNSQADYSTVAVTLLLAMEAHALILSHTLLPFSLPLNLHAAYAACAPGCAMKTNVLSGMLTE